MARRSTDETFMETVAVSRIFTDDTYARPTTQANIDRMAANYSTKAAGAVYLSLRSDGSYACLDGMHRVQACRAALGELATIDAKVYIDLTIEEEAGLFSDFNKERRTLWPGQVLRSDLAANKPYAHEIRNMLMGLGLDIAFDNEPDDNKIQAVSALVQLHRQNGVDLLREVVTLLRDTRSADGVTPTGAIQANVMKGLSAFLVRYRDTMDRDRLVTVLNENSNSRLIAQSHGMMEMSPGTNVPAGVGMALLNDYNKGIRSKAKMLGPWMRNAYGPVGIEVVRVTSVKNLPRTRTNGDG